MIRSLLPLTLLAFLPACLLGAPAPTDKEGEVDTAAPTAVAYIEASFSNGNFLVDVGPENLTITTGTAEADIEADGYGYTYEFTNLDATGITVRTDSYFMLVCKSDGADHRLIEGQVGSTADGYTPAGYIDCWTWYTDAYVEEFGLDE